MNSVPEVRKSERHELAVRNAADMAAFFLPGPMAAAFEEAGWDLYEMVEILTSIARGEKTVTKLDKNGNTVEVPAASVNHQLVAIRMLRDYARDAMVLSGGIRQERLTMTGRGADGTELRLDAEEQRLVENSSQRLQDTMSLLTAAARDPHETIEVKVLSVGEDNSETTQEPEGDQNGYDAETVRADREPGPGPGGYSGRDVGGPEPDGPGRGGQRTAPPGARTPQDDDHQGPAPPAEGHGGGRAGPGTPNGPVSDGRPGGPDEHPDHGDDEPGADPEPEGTPDAGPTGFDKLHEWLRNAESERDRRPTD